MKNTLLRNETAKEGTSTLFFMHTYTIAVAAAILAMSFFGLYTLGKTTNDTVEPLDVSKLGPQFHMSKDSDKYKRFEESIKTKRSLQNQYKLQTMDNEPIINNVRVSGKDHSWTIDGKKNMVVLSIGGKNIDDFEQPMLRSTEINPRIYTILSYQDKKEAESKASPSWTLVEYNGDYTSSALLQRVDLLLKEEMISIDTVFINVKDNEWSLLKQLLPRYSLMIRQYVLIMPSDLAPAFQSVREMKQLFRDAGYTYSRLGDSVNERVFMKE